MKPTYQLQDVVQIQREGTIGSLKAKSVADVVIVGIYFVKTFRSGLSINYLVCQKEPSSRDINSNGSDSSVSCTYIEEKEIVSLLGHNYNFDNGKFDSLLT